MTRALLVSVGFVLAATSLVWTAAGYREGPLPAMTGGFGEGTCRTCHFDNPENDRAGLLRVTGVPPSYAAGRRYPITITVQRGTLTVAGFEMSARFASGARAGQQAGTFRTPDARTQLVSGPGGLVQYIQHTKTGAAAIAGRGRWTIEWTAPATAAVPVAFHVAANAANDDASPLGDFIYTAVLTSR